jgi:hypothetical protein
MENDKLFAAYAAIIFLGISSVVTFVFVTGVGAIPATAFLLEHVILGLLIRGAYKAFDGESGLYVVWNGIRSLTEAGAIEASDGPTGALPSAG